MTTTNTTMAETEKQEKRKKVGIAISAGLVALLALGGAGFAIWSNRPVSRTERLADKSGPGDARLAGGRPQGGWQRGGGPGGRRGFGGPGGPGGGMMARMNKDLGLTPDQEKQMAAAGATMRPKMEALWKNESLSQEERFTQMKTIGDQMQAQMRTILNPEQQKKFDVMRTQMQARRQEMRERREQTRAALIASGQTPPERGPRGNGPRNERGR